MHGLGAIYFEKYREMHLKIGNKINLNIAFALYASKGNANQTICFSNGPILDICSNWFWYKSNAVQTLQINLELGFEHLLNEFTRPLCNSCAHIQKQNNKNGIYFSEETKKNLQQQFHGNCIETINHFTVIYHGDVLAHPRW